MSDEVSQYSLKFRPRYFRDVYGQDATVKALKKRVLTNDFPQAICLRGPFGCGKTSLALIMAAAMMAHTEDGEPDWNCPDNKSILNQTFDRDVMLLDASRWSGKDAMLEFTQSISTRPLYSRNGIRVCIIEEADQASSAAMLSLLKILESPKSFNKFILCSMEDKGVPKSVLSRCQCYNIKPLNIKDIMYGLKHILDETGLWEDEKIPQEFKLEGLATIAGVCEGSMRVAVQHLEKCIVNEVYTKSEIMNLLEVIDESTVWEMMDSLLKGEKNETVLRSIVGMKTGEQIMHFYQYCIMMLGEAVLYKETKVAYDEQCEPRLKKLASYPELERLFYCLTLHPQMNKPYLRTSDVVAAIASFYQGIDFRPNKGPVIADAFRPGVVCGPAVVEATPQKITIGVPPEKETLFKQPQVRVRRTANSMELNSNIPF